MKPFGDFGVLNRKVPVLSKRPWWLIICWLCLWLPLAALAADSLEWNKDKERLSADVRRTSLHELLEQMSTRTGWQVFLEPGTTHTSSVKFKDLSAGEGLRLLLGDLNFALVPQTNGSPRLYVFRTGMDMATEKVSTGKKKSARNAKRVPNQLIVQLKPGMSIDELAKQTGGKVIGSIPSMNIYLLEFPDEAATEAAKAILEASPIVEAVDYNYVVDQPPPAQALSGISANTPELTLNPPESSSCQPIIGLVDTALQSLGKNDSIVTERLSVTEDNTTAGGSTPTHATTMASAMIDTLASVTGKSTTVRIISMNVFDKEGNATTWSVSLGLKGVIDKGATIVNLSLGSSADSAVMQNLIAQATAKGIAIIAASGNEPTGEPIYPAGYDGVMAVTAVQNGQIASYANVWSGVSVAAPGTSLMEFNGSTWVSQGTSVSTAYVSGIAAGLTQTGCASWSDVQAMIKSRLALPQ